MTIQRVILDEVRDAGGAACNGCGRCCDPVVLPFSPIEIQTATDDGSFGGRANLRWMREDLTPILPRRRGIEMVADYMKAGAKTSHSFTPDSKAVVDFSFFYTCRHYDSETKECRAYEARPPACSEYPWGGGPPDAAKALPPECAYNEDLGRPVKLLATRSSKRREGEP